MNKLEDWENTFVEQTLLLDNEGGSNSSHKDAVHEALVRGRQGQHTSPQVVNEILGAGGYREEPKVGVTDPSLVSEYLWLWCRTARRYTSVSTKPAFKTAIAFSLHHEFMRINPFKKYNGSVGRILLINHLLLLKQRPQIIWASDKERYERWLRIQLT